MIKRALIAASALCATAGALMPNGAHAALGSQMGQYKLLADGTHLSLTLPAGVYDITSIGTYIHDNTVGTRADAFCSEESTRDPHWQDPVDVIDNDLFPVASKWHPYRFALNGDYLFSGGDYSLTPDNPLSSPLTVYVNGQPTVWAPTFPDVIDDSGAVSPCNTTTHQYDTTVISDGETPTVLNIYDLNYSDNADVNNPGAGDGAGLTIQVGQLLG